MPSSPNNDAGVIRPWARLLLVILTVALTATPAPAEGQDLRVALLPIIDSFPFHVARAEGLFDANQIAVEALVVGSAVQRDQLMQSGQIDGMLNELMSTANFNRSAPRLKVVSVVRASEAAHPLFRILGAPGSGLMAPQDLAGGVIGISRNTIIDYVTDRLLEASGLGADAVRKPSIPSIPERYQLLLQGRLAAATLPDPLAQSAMASGAVLLIDDRAIPGRSMSVLSFSNEALQTKVASVRRFLDAWQEAVARINRRPEAYRELLLETIRIPTNVQSDYRIPPFAHRRIPERVQWQDVMDWMMTQGLLEHPLTFETSVASNLLGPPAVP